MQKNKHNKDEVDIYKSREINLPKYEYQKPEYGFGYSGGKRYRDSDKKSEEESNG